MQEAPSRVMPQEQCRQEHEGLTDIGESEICALTGGNNEPRTCSVRKILNLNCFINTSRLRLKICVFFFRNEETEANLNFDTSYSGCQL